MALCLSATAGAQSLVLLHTNDTHSAIDADASGRGGVLARKALIDSVRAAEKNVLLVDAGDVVQGSLYFKLYNGEVEYPLMNLMDYDVRILGNHEFDNGLDDLARFWRGVKADRLSANYDFSDTPAKGLFKPWTIKKIGGKKVGFIGLNVDPQSLIVAENYAGMKFKDPIATANEAAAELKKHGADLVVAITHIGYDEPLGRPDDIALAKASKDIDIIIGGHSHTLIDPATPEKTPHWILNADGSDVLVAQTGRNGRYLGYIKLDLSDFKNQKMDYRVIPVTERFAPEAYSKEIIDFLAPYRSGVDSLNNLAVAWSLTEMPTGISTGAYPNWTADFAVDYSRELADTLRTSGLEIPNIDLAIMNVGGIRQPMRPGAVTEGQIMATFPFANRLRIIGLNGSDLIETFRTVAGKGGESVSREVKAILNADGSFKQALINGKPIDPNREYIITTIDYLAEGNDDMTPLKRHRPIWSDNREMYHRVLDYLRNLTAAGIPVTSDPSPRFVEDARNNLK